MSASYYRFASGRVILIKDQKVLLELRDSCEYAMDEWMIPGGHTERYENAMDSAVREMQEELGIRIRKSDLKFVSVVHWWNEKHQRSGITFFWSTHKWEGQIRKIEGDKCKELRWFSEEEIKNAVQHSAEEGKIGIEITSRKTLSALFANKLGVYLEADWKDQDDAAKCSDRSDDDEVNGDSYDCE